MRAVPFVPANVSVWHDAQLRCHDFCLGLHLRGFLGLCRRSWRQRGEIGTEIADVLIAELFGDRPHHLIFPGASTEEDQLPLQEDIWLPRQRRGNFDLGYAALTVTRRAERRPLLELNRPPRRPVLRTAQTP